MKPVAALPFLAFAALAAVVPPRPADVPASAGKPLPPRADAADENDVLLGELLAATDQAVEEQLNLIRQYDALVESSGALLESSDDGDSLVLILRETLAAAGTRRSEAVALMKKLSFVGEMCEYAASDTAADDGSLETPEPVLDMCRQVLAGLGHPHAAPLPAATKGARKRRSPCSTCGDNPSPARPGPPRSGGGGGGGGVPDSTT